MSDNTRPIKDLYLAAILEISGHEIQDVQYKSDEGAFTFMFDADDVRNTEKKYWDGNLEINAKAFTNKIRDLKGRMRSISDKKGSLRVRHTN